MNKTGLDALLEKSGGLCAAFIGGSITEGTNRATPGNFYVDIVGDAFKKRYPGARIINAGWGGTGSEFGLFRLGDDVMRHSPDIVFVEFAANDVLKTDADTVFYMECIVKRLLSLPKIPVIIFLYTADRNYRTSAVAHHEVALRYGIPEIYIYEHIRELIGRGVICADEIFGDEIHPNNLGYKYYAEYICGCIFSGGRDFFRLPDANAEPINKKMLLHARIVNNTAAQAEGGWQQCPAPNRHLCPAIEGRAGGRVIFEFDGDFIGVLCEDMYMSGSALCILDGEEIGCARAAAYRPALMRGGLADTHHRLVLEPTGDAPFRLAAFMVNASE